MNAHVKPDEMDDVYYMLTLRVVERELLTLRNVALRQTSILLIVEPFMTRVVFKCGATQLKNTGNL